eukprot:1879273-Rhodomonas_salina.2
MSTADSASLLVQHEPQHAMSGADAACAAASRWRARKVLWAGALASSGQLAISLLSPPLPPAPLSFVLAMSLLPPPLTDSSSALPGPLFLAHSLHPSSAPTLSFSLSGCFLRTPMMR